MALLQHGSDAALATAIALAQMTGVTDTRPWGSFTILDEGVGYKIKRIEVHPGHRLSLQMHYHRSEHWIVVSGTARVTCDNQETVLCSNQSTYVPQTKVHRLENPGVIPLIVIEVQNGDYLGRMTLSAFKMITPASKLALAINSECITHRFGRQIFIRRSRSTKYSASS